MKGKYKISIMFLVSILMSVCILYALSFYYVSKTESRDEILPTHQKTDGVVSKQISNTKEIIPQQIMKEVKHRYDAFSSYECEGNIKEFNPYKKITDRETNFNLKYEYPSKIEINWVVNSLKKTFSGNKESTFLMVNGKPVEKFDDPFWGLSALASREDTNLFEIGKILLGKEKNSDEYFIKDVIVEPKVTTEEMDGVLCYKISTSLPLNYKGQITYWIETNSLLIKKIQREIKFDEKNENTYNYTEFYTKIFTK